MCLDLRRNVHSVERLKVQCDARHPSVPDSAELGQRQRRLLRFAVPVNVRAEAAAARLRPKPRLVTIGFPPGDNMETPVADLKKTVNLPKTEFPMKANLPQLEPRLLERWKTGD